MIELENFLLASNRGPVSISTEKGKRLVTRGAGGVVSALTAIAHKKTTKWFCSPFTEEERQAAGTSQSIALSGVAKGSDYQYQFIDIDQDIFEGAYNRISNSLLWFATHYLYDLAFSPSFTNDDYRSWEHYQELNSRFCAELVRVGGERDWVCIHDYHLLLLPGMLREKGCPSLISHFIHTPWTQPDYLEVLPLEISTALLEGVLAADLIGMQSPRNVRNFLWCCQELLAAEVDWSGGSVIHNGNKTQLASFPIPIDPESLAEEAERPEVREEVENLRRLVDGKKLVLRVDRVDPSKNAVRGFEAYEAFLEQNTEWHGKVVFLALLHPSRSDLKIYQRFSREVEEACDRINKRFGQKEWSPVVLNMRDDINQSLAALELFDVLLVNPIFDGMNLVAKEGSLLNRYGGVVVLSTNAGAYEELAPDALGINPFDITQTAEALKRALNMSGQERSERSERLREKVSCRNTMNWLEEQYASLELIRETRL